MNMILDSTQRALLDRQARLETPRGSFIDFVREVSPRFVVEEVHLMIADALERLVFGGLDRLMIFMPPRTGKSTLVSVYFPAWYIGHFPANEVMHVAYSENLSSRWGMMVKMTINDPRYAEIFPHVKLHPDMRAAGRWAILPPDVSYRNQKSARNMGSYLATSIESGIAGLGFNLGIIDDPLTEKTANSEVVKNRINEDWYGPGFYTRQNLEGASIVVMCTRWAEDDLPGFLLSKAKDEEDDEFADQWEVLSIPAEVDEDSIDRLNAARDDPRLLGDHGPEFKIGDSFLPRRLPLPKLKRLRAGVITGGNERKYNALYLQRAVAHDGNIIKRSWWRHWRKAALPQPEFILQCYDTAFEEGEENDFCARTTWGVFKHSDTGDPADAFFCMMLLSVMNEKLEYPDLRMLAYADYRAENPDAVIIERKASGHSLIQDLRRKRLPIKPFDPKNRSKLARTHQISSVFQMGSVWVPMQAHRHQVINQCAAFPFGEHDDLHDTVVMAAMYLRRMFHLQMKDEEQANKADDENFGQDYDPRAQGRGRTRNRKSYG